MAQHIIYFNGEKIDLNAPNDDPHVSSTKREAACGCFIIDEYNDDPDFSGYDTDRDETRQMLCEEHKHSLTEKQKNLEELRFRSFKLIEEAEKDRDETRQMLCEGHKHSLTEKQKILKSYALDRLN